MLSIIYVSVTNSTAEAYDERWQSDPERPSDRASTGGPDWVDDQGA
jgi:hypothetical protein